MDKNYVLIIKGFIVGLGKIIPGVSGALLAISMGIYDKALNAISNFFKDIKNNIKFLMPLGIGLLLAIIFCSNIISYFINNYYLITMLLFLGLIIGGIPSLFKTFYKIKINHKDYYFLLIMILIGLIVYFIIISNIFDINYLLKYSVIYWLMIGSIDALTMIIPGISGTGIFVMLGCFNDIIYMYANPLVNISSIIPFISGIIITVLLITKLITWLFKNCSKSMYLIILILLIISIISLINNIFSSNFTIFELTIGIVLFIIGFIVTYILEK